MQQTPLVVFALMCALTCTGLAQPQSSQPSTPPPAAGAAPAANPSAVAPDQAVITLKGACEAKPGNPAPAATCVSAVTKAQFEKLVTALKPDITSDEKRNLAQNYGKLLVFTDVARALGLENDPKVQQVMSFYTDQILAQAVNQHYAQEYAHPTDQQIEDYYKQNSGKYSEATLQRVIIPRSTGGTDKPKPSEAEEKAYADQIRQKWVAGGDPAKLQAEAMEHAGIKAPAPDVNLGAKHPGSLPAQHESAFGLKPDEVSQLFSDPSAFYLYKMVSVKETPLTEVKESIAKTLTQQLVREKMESIANSVTPALNDTYFGPPPAVGPPQPHSMQHGAPPAAPEHNQGSPQ